MKKLLAVVLAACTAFALASCNNNADKSYTSGNTEYVIGCTGPLTGDASSYGISVQKGATLAVDEINKNGGLNGVKFKLDMKDDKAAAADAASAYDMLYESGMQVSLGSVTSGSCASFASKAKEDNVFFITPSASAANVIESGKNAFRVCFGDPDQGILAAKEINEKYETVGVIYDTSDPYSSGIYEAFKGEMEKLGKEYAVRTFDAENKKDFSAQVEALKDCDVIFLPFYYTEAGLVAKTAVAKGSEAVLFGCDGFDGIDGQIDNSVTNLIRYITPFDVNSTDANVADFVQAYKDAYSGEAPDQFAADGYDAVYAIFNAMQKAGINDVTISASDLCDKLIPAITADDFTYTGATGTMTWDASGACNKIPTIIELQK